MCASFFGAVASADRLLAIHHYLRYQELVILVWMLTAIQALIYHFEWIPTNRIFTVAGTIDSVCYITTALFYFKIYLAVRHHRNQIHVLQALLAQNGKVIANAARQRKSAIGTFYVYIVLLVCNLTATCFWIVVASTGVNAVTWRNLALYTNTLMYLNSSLWKMTHIICSMDLLNSCY